MPSTNSSAEPHQSIHLNRYKLTKMDSWFFRSGIFSLENISSTKVQPGRDNTISGELQVLQSRPPTLMHTNPPVVTGSNTLSCIAFVQYLRPPALAYTSHTAQSLPKNTGRITSVLQVHESRVVEKKLKTPIFQQKNIPRLTVPSVE